MFKWNSCALIYAIEIRTAFQLDMSTNNTVKVFRKICFNSFYSIYPALDELECRGPVIDILDKLKRQRYTIFGTAGAMRSKEVVVAALCYWN